MGEGAQRLSYEQALLAYLSVIGGSVKFDRAPGFAAPAGEESTREPLNCQADGTGEVDRNDIYNHATGNHGVIRDDYSLLDDDIRDVGLGLLVEEARDFLIQEGLHKPTVDAFLRPFVSSGAV